MSARLPEASVWATAAVVARLFAHDPFGTGIHVRASAGPVRDRFLGMLRAMMPVEAPWRRCPASIADDRLLGGLDLGATLATGQAVVARGLLAEADGGIVVIGAAERLASGTAARLGAALDLGEVVAERDGFAMRHAARIGLVLLDEGMEETLPPGMRDRLAFRIDLDGVRLSETTAVPAEDTMVYSGAIATEAGVVEALCATAEALGIGSARAEWLALRAARSAAALDGRASVTDADATLAAQLVLAHRATRMPQSAEPPPESADDAEQDERETPETERSDAADDEQAETPPLDDILADAVLAAAVASLPPDLLAQLAAGGRAGHEAGRRGMAKPGATRRGRPIASRPGRPGNGLRLDVVETLRAAAPWQRLRRQAAGTGRVAFRAGDLHVRRYKSQPRATTVFVVDASGSAALNRLAEAKGAVELMLGECYIRRDQVALFAFRGTTAELLLPPTGALARARRCLGGLPGGGGTPLAAGLEAARALAETLRRQGDMPKLVMLTDGRANVALDGVMDRGRAMADAERVARHLRATGLPALVIDISPRPQPEAARIAAAMGARLLALPRADAAALSRAVRAAA
jgi:magnesium chelatase subunit D